MEQVAQNMAGRLDREEGYGKNVLIVIFIYLSIFINSYVFFKQPFEFYFGYLIFVLLLPGFVLKYSFNRGLSFIFLTLLVTGVFNVLMGNNTFPQFFKVYVGLTLSYFFYYYVIVDFEYDVEKLFKWYLKGAYYVSLIGIVQFISYQVNFEPGYKFNWIFNKWGFIQGGNFGIRVNSVFSEPTYLGSTLSSAFFVSLYNVLRRESYGLSKMQSLVVILVYLLSFSGLGQTGIFLSLIFLAISFGLVRYIIVVIPLGIMLFSYLHNNVKDFRERYDSLIELFTTGKFVLGKTHGSSFILYNNYVVALENFQTNFLFGTGIGSHGTAFDKYSLARNFKVKGFNSNSADANSMLLRLVSETGLFGVLIFIFLMVSCYIRRDEGEESYHWLISNSILIMILLNLFRQGHYFINGFPFFLLLYYFNSVAYKNFRETREIQNNDDLTLIEKDPGAITSGSAAP